MKALHHHTLVFTLALSVLLHGIVLFYVQNDVGDSKINQPASVIVQIELLAKKLISSSDQITENKTIEQVVVENNGKFLNTVKKNVDPEKIPLNQQKQLVTDVDIVAEYSDIKVTKNHSSGDRVNQLRKHVYEAISKEKYYPYIAKKQRREGVVKLDFVLHPDGLITDVLILQTSRHIALDKAARHAVEAISPFQLAAEYLDAQHHYTVDIDFRLN